MDIVIAGKGQVLGQLLSVRKVGQGANPKEPARADRCFSGQVLPTVRGFVDSDQLPYWVDAQVVTPCPLGPVHTNFIPFPPRPAFGFGLDWYDATGITFLPFRLALASIAALPSW